MAAVVEILPRSINSLERVVVKVEEIITKALFAAIALNRLTELPNMGPQDHLVTAITLTSLFLLHSWTCRQNENLKRLNISAMGH